MFPVPYTDRMKPTIVLLTICHLSCARPQGETVPLQQRSFSIKDSQRPARPVELAKPAQCKVRPEVQEITRAMIDNTSASFLIWPSCVEVQRCSGCCNTKIYQCQPSVQQTRRVLIIKKNLRRRKLESSKIEVILVDHVECQCVRISDSKFMKAEPRFREVLVPRKDHHQQHHRKLRKYKQLPTTRKELMFT